ncbi:MAG TPA: PepSY-associated TM helix domain-containing protein [Bryobacteraceae bacterium]|nr:PepSY-associated TM helix domain-containing protein [Bryobacteraceae bacterium]
MSGGNPLTVWQRWLRQPQRLWIRRALFQVHLWSGIAVGLYILMISVTGSVLVYRNELFRAATPAPIISKGPGPRLTDDQLKDAAARVYPGYRVVVVGRARDPDQAVDVSLGRGDEVKKRMFDPRSGADLGDSVPTGIRLVSKLIDLHDNLLAGAAGRKVNGAGALATLVLAATGLTIWWPGVKTWRRSLILPHGLGWKRWTWHLHSMIGFWSLGFTLVFAFSGIYLANPDLLQDIADKLEPLTAANAGFRVGDRVIYWLAYLHFGRINGIGIPCSGPGICDQTTKATWAIFGLAPAAMFATGAIMWWNRVLRPGWKALIPIFPAKRS